MSKTLNSNYSLNNLLRILKSNPGKKQLSTNKLFVALHKTIQLQHYEYLL